MPETVDSHISDIIVDFICRVDCVHRDFVASDCEFQALTESAARNIHLDFRSRLSAQKIRHLRSLDAYHAFTVDSDDTVIRQNAHIGGGCAGYGVGYHNGVAKHTESDADAAELSVELDAHGFHLLGGYVRRVRVEFLQHRRNSLFDKRRHLHLVYVCGIKIAVNLIEFA